MHLEYAQNISKFSQILNEPFQNGPSFVMVCQSGEISPNLVTLVEKQYPIFTEKRKLRFGLQNERRNKKTGGRFYSGKCRDSNPKQIFVQSQKWISILWLGKSFFHLIFIKSDQRLSKILALQRYLVGREPLILRYLVGRESLILRYLVR